MVKCQELPPLKKQVFGLSMQNRSARIYLPNLACACGLSSIAAGAARAEFTATEAAVSAVKGALVL